MNEQGGDRRLAALIEAGMALAAALDLDSLLQRIADLAREVIGAAYSAVGVLGEDGALIKFIYSGMPEHAVSQIGHLPEGKGVLGVIIEHPLRLPEVSGHPKSAGFPEHHPDMHSFLGVPISARGRIFGRLYLTNKKDAPEFSPEDEQIVLTFAAQAGVAIENVFLLQEITAKTEDVAVLEERERIAKELHDGVIQSIYSVGLSLQGSSSLITQDQTRAKARIEEAIAELDNVIRSVRSYIFQLRPKELEEKGLVSAISELTREFEINTLAHVDLQVEGAAFQQIGQAVEAELIQITREVLSNIARHAAASEVLIKAEVVSGSLELTIEDNGVGFDPSAVNAGFGLKNMEERARRMGGEMNIGPRLPKGTKHIFWIPATENPDD